MRFKVFSFLLGFLLLTLQQPLVSLATGKTGGGKKVPFKSRRQGNDLRPPTRLTAIKKGNTVDLSWQPPATSQTEGIPPQTLLQGVTEVEPNNGFTTAQTISPNTIVNGIAQVSDQGEYVFTFADGTKDDFEDVFRFTITQSSTVSVTLDYSPASADLDVWVLANDPKLIVLDDDGASTDNPEMTIVNLNPGTYLIAVSTFEPGPPIPAQDGSYTLTVKTTPNEPPPNQVKNYNLYRSTLPTVQIKPENRVGTVPGNITKFTDTVPVSDKTTLYNYVVTALYEAGESGPSNQATAMETGDTLPPTVKVTSPNGGETIQAGTQLQISWTATDNVGVTSQEVTLSTDGGNTFPIPVTTGLPGGTESFSFAVPPTLSTTQARVRVLANDAAGNQGTDTSDANFTIKPQDSIPPTVKVLSPNSSSDKLKAGNTFLIQWQSSDNIGVVSQDVLFSTDGGATFPVKLATGLPGSVQSFAFAVPATQPKSKTARIRVVARDAAGNSSQDDSDVNIKVKPKR